MKVYIVCGGCVDDYHIIAIYKSLKRRKNVRIRRIKIVMGLMPILKNTKFQNKHNNNVVNLEG